MKKFIKIFSLLLVITSVTVFQACKDDSEDPTPSPTVTGPTAVTSVQIGTTADVTFTFKADGGYGSATVAATGGTAAVKTAGTAGATTGSVVVTFTADNTAGAAQVTLTLTDGKAQTAVGVAVLNKTISAPPQIALSANSGAANPGGTVAVTVELTAENGAKTITYETTGGLQGSPASPITLADNNSVEVTFTVPENTALGATLTASFYGTDDQDLNSSTKVFTVTASTNELTGKLESDMTLEKGVSYLITGQFVVMSGVTLTVEPGAVIRADKPSKGVLIVKQGGKLMAEGTAEEPIVFTSSKAPGDRDRGDWGGIIIMGDAYVNQSAKPAVEGLTPPAEDADFFKYGTVNQADASVGVNDQNSGSLKYVRIEYAGIELIPNSETNGLTMAGVGSGTSIDYVQSSYGGDDGFEWFGGSVSAKHLVSFATWDDDFDTDFGWRGMVQFGLAVRAPFIADQSGSTSFESDSQGNANAIGTVCDGTNATGCTQGVFSNMTVLGPRDYNIGISVTGSAPNGVARATSGNYTRAMHIRRRTAISIFNSFVSGYGSASGPATQGLQMDDAGTVTNYNNGVGAFGNNVLMFPDASAAVYGTNITGAGEPAASLASITGFWETGNASGSASAVVKPIVGALWSPNPGTPAGSINPYTQYGIDATLFYGASTSSSYMSNPNFAVTTGDLTDQDAGDLFDSGKLGNEFFDNTVTYKGAFGATDWTDGWSEFQPLTKVY